MLEVQFGFGSGCDAGTPPMPLFMIHLCWFLTLDLQPKFQAEKYLYLMKILYEEDRLAYDLTTFSQIILTCASLQIYCCHSWGLMVIINHQIRRHGRKLSPHARYGGSIIYLLALTYNKNNFSVDLSSYTQATMSSRD